jgi:YIF1
MHTRVLHRGELFSDRTLASSYDSQQHLQRAVHYAYIMKRTAYAQYGKPSADENAPDLYVPLMAFITYALITGFVKGRASTFTPEVSDFPLKHRSALFRTFFGTVPHCFLQRALPTFLFIYPVQPIWLYRCTVATATMMHTESEAVLEALQLVVGTLAQNALISCTCINMHCSGQVCFVSAYSTVAALVLNQLKDLGLRYI